MKEKDMAVNRMIWSVVLMGRDKDAENHTSSWHSSESKFAVNDDNLYWKRN